MGHSETFGKEKEAMVKQRKLNEVRTNIVRKPWGIACDLFIEVQTRFRITEQMMYKKDVFARLANKTGANKKRSKQKKK